MCVCGGGGVELVAPNSVILPVLPRTTTLVLIIPRFVYLLIKKLHLKLFFFNSKSKYRTNAQLFLDINSY